MNGRHACQMACSSGHPSQTDNYLDTKKLPKTFCIRALPLRKKKTSRLGPSTGRTSICDGYY
jgi:hypothetical protein